MENEKLDITPTVGLLALLKNMRYTEWYALGEFVDNSIQSYRLNKKFPFTYINELLPKAPKFRKYYQKNSDGLV